MKRNYINPKTTCIEVELEQLIAESLTSEGLEGTGSGGDTGENGVVEADAKAERGWASGW